VYSHQPIERAVMILRQKSPGSLLPGMINPEQTQPASWLGFWEKEIFSCRCANEREKRTYK
jgi:hypothetical protein